MDDLISRQAAIDALNTLFKKQVTQFGYEGYEKADEKTQLVCDGISESIGCVMNLLSVQPETHEERTETHDWIPVTERLPEEYKDVLCCYEYFRYGDYNCMFRTIDRGYYGNGIWGGEAGQGHKNKVLAWMPLPEAYKGEQG